MLGWGLLALVLSAAPASAGGLLHCHRRTCAGADCPPPVCTIQEPCIEDKICFHLEITEQKCTEPGKLQWVAKVKDTEIEVPCTRHVPVCVTDPCTGCTHTEFKEETVLKKCNQRIIDICPDKCAEVEKVRKCVTIVVNHTPVTVMKEIPVSCPCCGH
jgi:hypothetical protein